MDWNKVLETVLNESPVWGPFLIALGMIMFFVVKPLLNGVRETALKQSENIAALTSAIGTLNLAIVTNNDQAISRLELVARDVGIMKNDISVMRQSGPVIIQK